MRGYAPLVAVKLEASQVRRVDCGTCPVTLACAIEKGGNGYTFKCCGSTGFLVEDDQGQPLLLLIDCAVHKFEINDIASDMPPCPLCSGLVLEISMRQMGTPSMWVPTVHSRVPVETRLGLWRRELPLAVARVIESERRKKGA